MSVRIKAGDQSYVASSINDCKSKIDENLFTLVKMFKGFVKIGNSFAMPE